MTDAVAMLETLKKRANEIMHRIFAVDDIIVAITGLVVLHAKSNLRNNTDILPQSVDRHALNDAC